MSTRSSSTSAKAVLLHLCMEAQRQWRLSLVPPTIATTPATTSSPTPASTFKASTDEKPCKTFLAWAKCVEAYEMKLDGARRKFTPGSHLGGGGRNPGLTPPRRTQPPRPKNGGGLRPNCRRCAWKQANWWSPRSAHRRGGVRPLGLDLGGDGPLTRRQRLHRMVHAESHRTPAAPPAHQRLLVVGSMENRPVAKAPPPGRSRACHARIGPIGTSPGTTPAGEQQAGAGQALGTARDRGFALPHVARRAMTLSCCRPSMELGQHATWSRSSSAAHAWR